MEQQKSNDQTIQTARIEEYERSYEGRVPMFRTEEKTEVRFEDGFFDDMIAGLEKLRAVKPNGKYDAGWNAAVKTCIYKLYSFFGRGALPSRIMEEFPEQVSREPDKECEKGYEKALLFDSIARELLSLRFPCPTTDENQVWNSAIFACLTKLGQLFDKTDALNDISGEFNLKTSASSVSSGSTEGAAEEVTSAPVGEIRPLIEDGINHPSWYNRGGGIETLDFIESNKLSFTRGNAVKYITRAGYKDPAQEIADLRKARFYIDWEINRLKGKD